MIVAFLILIAVVVLLWLVVAAGFIALPFLGILVIFLAASYFEKKHKKAAKSRQKPLYEEQLKELIPQTRFFLDAQPLTEKEIHGVEQKLEIRGQIEALAKKHGLSADPNKLSFLYYDGFRAIKEAQKAYLLKQENGKAIMFYLLLQGWDGLNGKKGIRDPIDSGCHTDSIAEAMNESGLAKIARETFSYRRLTDEEKMCAIRFFDEGKAAYTQLKKTSQTLLPPYYYSWLINESCETPAVFLQN